MNNREQFEVWYLDAWGCTEDNLDSLFDESPHGNEYYRFGVRLAWQAWQQATKQDEAKYAAQDEKLHMINELTGAEEQVNKLAQEATERLIQERNALAAENAELKAFGVKLGGMHNDLNGEGTGIQGRAEVAIQQVALEAAMEEFYAIKTPATDAYLAEVRAHGVEMFASALEARGRHHEYVEIANAYAAQLRQEAAQ